MRLGDLDETALILLTVNAVAWGINIGLLSLWVIR